MTSADETDLWNGALISARIWHGRAGKVSHAFRYRATYVAMPVAQIDGGGGAFPVNRVGLWSIRSRDFGRGDGASLQGFVAELLAGVGLNAANDVTIIAMPRSFGYGFNPVSFWLCRDGSGALRAVLAEVSNTFNERHHYLCYRPDLGPITRADRLTGEKLFHVSPFLPRSGTYLFRFDPGPGRFGAWVDWQAKDGTVHLGTSMTGRAQPLTRARFQAAALRHPFQSQKIIGLIHWQALRLYLRGVRYLRKPIQLAQRISRADRHSKLEE